MGDIETPRGRHRAETDEDARVPVAEPETGDAAGTAASHAEAPAAASTLPPDAAARDAAKRRNAGADDDAVHGDDIHFVTRGVSREDRAAVIAVLTAVRAEETQRVKKVSRRDREPWSRSQRVPEGIADLLAD